MRRIVPFNKLDDFIFPLMEQVCKPRGISDEGQLYVATCRDCGVQLNQAWLASQASLLVMGSSFADACLQCGSVELVAIVSGLTPEEEDRLRRDQFFSTLLERD